MIQKNDTKNDTKNNTKNNTKDRYLFVEYMLSILNPIIYLILDLIFVIVDLICILIYILIVFIGPHIRKYLIFFIMGHILTFLFNDYSLFFGIVSSDLDPLVIALVFLRDLINNIRDIIYLDFYFVMLVLHSIYTKDITLFNYLFCFFLLYLYISNI